MRILVLLFLALPITTSSGIAGQLQEDLIYSAQEKNRFIIKVEYFKYPDGKEICSLNQRVYDPNSQFTLFVFGEPNPNKAPIILLYFPKSLFGLLDPPVSDALHFEFKKMDGKYTQGSILDYWNFPIREIDRSDEGIEYTLAMHIDTFWGFARDWYDSAAVYVTNEIGEDVTSMTLHKGEEGMKALADCWSGTQGY